MPNEPRILELVEDVLESQRTPEEVCADDPELLEEVRARWRRLRVVAEQVEALFPTTEVVSTARRSVPRDGALPNIPGYQIESILGQGGMGVVYQARHLRLNRPVALKMLLAGAYATDVELSRFRREAEAVASLKHENIVQLYDVGEIDGRPYFTMELVEGGSLAQKLSGTPQPADCAADLLYNLANAVQAAHDGCVVHRDLKPGNVLMAAGCVPKISDFGLARRCYSESHLTVSGAPMGTPSYMAPEQALGDNDSVGPATDVYALGAILYELLTGRPPFRAETAAETQRQLVCEEPAPPSKLNVKVPRDLETICLKCLQKLPQRRYASAAELAADLERYRRGEPIRARRVGRLERAFRWTRRNPTGAALIVTALLLFVVAVAAGAREWRLSAARHAEIANWAPRLTYLHQLQREGRFDEGRAILGNISDTDSAEVRDQIKAAMVELDLAEQLDKIRMGRAASVHRYFDPKQSDVEYKEAFRVAGLGTIDEAPQVVAERIARLNIRGVVVAAIDDWAISSEDLDLREWLMAVARSADPEPSWRDRVRDTKMWMNVPALKELATTADVRGQSVNLLLLLGGLLNANNQDATAYMRRVQAAHADDFWCNFRLAEMLDAKRHPDAVGFYRAALAIRPKAIAAHVNLGVALVAAKRVEEAVAQWELALRIDPNAGMVHLNLAVAAVNRGDFDVAIHHSRETLRVEPTKGQAYAIMGQSLMQQHRYAEAQAALARGVEVLDAKDPIREVTVVQLNRANEKMALERRLEEIDRGESQPQGAGERVGLAELLLARKRYADAVKYYSAAFIAEPKLAAAPESPYRYNAACSAALAAMQPGMADVQQQHREVALGWLREELDGLLKSEPSDGANVLPMREQLIHWRSDPDLAGVRDAAALKNCTPAQREACVALWADVDAAIAKSIAK